MNMTGPVHSNQLIGPGGNRHIIDFIRGSSVGVNSDCVCVCVSVSLVLVLGGILDHQFYTYLSF